MDVDSLSGYLESSTTDCGTCQGRGAGKGKRAWKRRLGLNIMRALHVERGVG